MLTFKDYEQAYQHCEEESTEWGCGCGCGEHTIVEYEIVGDFVTMTTTEFYMNGGSDTQVEKVGEIQSSQ